MSDALSMSGASNATGSVVVFEPSSSSPTNIFDTNKDWSARVQWQATIHMSGGTWRVSLHLASLVPGANLALTGAALTVPVVPGPGPVSYSEETKIAAGTVPAGTYRLVILIDYIDENGKPGPIAGFIEGPILQFYDPHIEPHMPWPEPG